MPTFISYSHQDAELVNTFTLHLANNDIKVLRDANRILPGDRFAEQIYDWIGSANSACIFVSAHSLASTWVNAEIDACVRRASADGKFVILPIRLDESELPRPLQDRVFIDARNGVEASFGSILTVIRAAEQSGAQGKVNPYGTAYFDFGVHSEIANGKYSMELDVVSYDNHESFSILSQFTFQALIDRVWEKLGFDDPAPLKNHLLRTCAEAFATTPALITITSARVRRDRFTLSDDSGEECIAVSVRTSTLGEGPRGAVAFDSGALFRQICDTLGIELDADLPKRGSLGGLITAIPGSAGSDATNQEPGTADNRS